MKKYFSLTITFIFTLNCALGQTKSDSIDVTKVKVLAASENYIDGFKVYSNLTKEDSVNTLKDFANKLNGCWTSKSDRQQKFNVSLTNFSGTWFTKGIHSTAPLIRLENTHYCFCQV